ncbi:DUF1080 domain-containing protein [Verrucomicrobium spinosum]|uniref:DUF1080 domain-containing protein n=1 Tax=Verrucomicrobium spinosum TaxID=2736 RepID=UPI000A59C6D4|nr:DUF1080 domain-containing protein [Verrucomicrobium spinosum]
MKLPALVPAIAATLAIVTTLVSPTHAAPDDTWQPETGFVSLFNGKDLTGWNDPKKGENFDGKTASSDGRYTAAGGVLTVNPPRMSPGSSSRSTL